MVDRLRDNFCLFRDSIVANDIMYQLYEKRALSDNDLDIIDSIAGNERKTIKLLRLLLGKKDTTWIFAFRDTLTDADNEFMHSLAENLERDKTAM